MIKRGKRKFSDENVVKELVELRDQGWSFKMLAEKYHCNHSSVIYQYSKYKHVGNAYLKNMIKDKPEPLHYSKGHCSKCDMLLTSEYHLKNPCII